jgi:enoyl-CoA hydratase/carnithine racemase
MTTSFFEVHMDLPSRNALDEYSCAWLEERLTEADGRPLLLRGTSDAFCAGLNLKRVLDLEGGAMADFLDAVARPLVRLFEYPAPTLALVEGHAIAGGCVLVQCCDYRLALDDERLRIGVNEVALGACFPPALLRIMVHRIPRRHVGEVLLGAQLHCPERALQVGLLDELSPQPEEAAKEKLKALASHPHATYASTKRALRSGVTDLTAEDRRRFLEDEVPLWSSDELRGRVRAALGK